MHQTNDTLQHMEDQGLCSGQNVKVVSGKVSVLISFLGHVGQVFKYKY